MIAVCIPRFFIISTVMVTIFTVTLVGGFVSEVLVRRR